MLEIIVELWSTYNLKTGKVSNPNGGWDDVMDYDKVRQKEVYVATTYLGEDRKAFFDLLKTNYEHFFSEDKQMIKYKNLSDLSNENIRKTLLASCKKRFLFFFLF